MTHLPLLGWETRENLLQAATDLNAAADLLDRSSWLRNDYREYRGTDNAGEHWAYCAQGAIRQATDYNWYLPSGAQTSDRSFTAGAVFYRVTGQWLPSFNDAPSSTKEQVAAKLREVAHLVNLKIGKEETSAPQP